MASSDDRNELNPPTDVLPSPLNREELRPGARLGQYQLLERLGAGGMGEVYKAVHVTMQRLVAIKIMAPHLVADSRARARFLREVRSAARLVHPNIVLAFDAEAEGDRCFLVMEYVEGWDAAALIQAGGLPPVSVACEIIRQAALGLQHAHEMGVVHRDIKPGNLIVAPRRPVARDSGLVVRLDETHPPVPTAWPVEIAVKILDLGLARLVDPTDGEGAPRPGHTPLTREGFVVGTPEFMSPEQASNSKALDIRSDIYSLGCTLYCLLTGQPPFSGDSLLEVMVQHMQVQPEPVIVRRPDVPPALSGALARMLAKKPEHRYQTPAEVAEALAPFSLSGAEAVATSPAPAPRLHGSTEIVERPSGATPVTRPPSPPSPRPSAEPTGGLRVLRTFLGCGALFMLLLFSMTLGLVLFDKLHREPPTEVDELALSLVELPFGTLEGPSWTSTPGTLTLPHNFYISTTEVTRRQFRLFAQDRERPYKTLAERESARGAFLARQDGEPQEVAGASWRTQPPGESDDAAVVCVAWEDAIEYCNWASKRDNRTPCYTRDSVKGTWVCNFEANGYRLPTEAEWEYAAKIGGGPLVPSAEELKLLAWVGESRGPWDVKQKLPTSRRYGLYDLLGNVWEWCQDPYEEAPRPLNWTGPEVVSSKRVVRGGGWADLPRTLQAAQGTRKGLSPEYRANDVGFRVVRRVRD